MPPETLRVLANVLALGAGLWLGQQVTVATLGASRGELPLAERKTRPERDIRSYSRHFGVRQSSETKQQGQEVHRIYRQKQHQVIN